MPIFGRRPDGPGPKKDGDRVAEKAEAPKKQKENKNDKKIDSKRDC